MIEKHTTTLSEICVFICFVVIVLIGISFAFGGIPCNEPTVSK